MDEQSDHDLLVRLDTKLGVVLDQLKRIDDRHVALEGRVSALESNSGRNSEKVSAITEDVRRSLANYEEIQAIKTKLDAFEERTDSIAGTSKLWDILIAVGATASFLASIFLK